MNGAFLLLRPFPGYGNIRMWDYSGYSNYHALQTSVSRRFDRGFMLSGLRPGLASVMRGYFVPLPYTSFEMFHRLSPGLIV